MFRTTDVQKMKTHFTFNNFFPPENRAVYEMWKKFYTAGQTTDDIMGHVHCMLDN